MLVKLSRMQKYMLGGFLLAWNAGFINTVAVLSSFQQPVSHLTGTVTRLSIAFVHHHNQIGFWFGLMIAFVGGSMVSGVVIDSTKLRFGRRYGVILMMEGGILGVATVLLAQGQLLGLWGMCFACGMQNGLVTTYSGAIVRTSHMSGILTDIGIYLGKWFWHQEREKWRLQIYIILLVGFCLGGVGATVGVDWLGNQALFVPALLSGGLGFGYWSWRQILAISST